MESNLATHRLPAANEDTRRIAILNAHWLLHSSVSHMATCLEKAGYLVDVFLYRSDETFSRELLKLSSAVRVFRMDATSSSSGRSETSANRGIHTIAAPMKRSLLKRLSDLLPSDLRRRLVQFYDEILLKVRPEFGIIPQPLIEAIVERARTAPYAGIIGVEKGGLAWAGSVSERIGAPLIYYSLELYTWDHPYLATSMRMRRYKLTEEKYHRRSALTIIQDDYRGRALLADNKVNSTMMRLAYLPVSASGPPYLELSQWLQKELDLGAEHVLILYYGLICEQRLNFEMAQAAQMFPEKWRLVFHGQGSPEVISKIRELDRKNRVCLSLNLVPADRQQDVVRSAQIGLALYLPENLNDRLTGRSSEKIALYFQCGIPTIAFRQESYEHIEAAKAGILIDRMGDVPAAVDNILKDYESYSANATLCYQQYYCFERNFEAVLSGLNHIIHHNRRRPVEALCQ